ncbi:MAG: quinone-dependent dihydroorotate dehydrogenase [Thiobacillaceae bacterium]|nr:quinone-dependent dihydroorotate dehydrogenase [Thiobacillaceae bacterium]MDW8324620.1 quinone-dependent dihydroorotate dehydrogenase [Burkholderiales bacterium]
MDLYPLLRALLFRLEPERAHALILATLARLQHTGLLERLLPAVPALPVRVMGLDFPNPVGLAAGLDKDARAIDAWAAMGFGFIEVGAVTPRPQPGNPRPRLFRLPQAQALINRMGFNNAGVDGLLANLQRCRYRGILAVNIGKNRDTPLEHAADDYEYCFERLYARVSFVTLNISSPNTQGLRALQGGEALDALLGRLKAAQARLTERHGKYTPLAVKVAPDLDADQIRLMADAFRRHRVDAVIATNTTVSRAGVEGLPHAEEQGGLSGAPLLAPSNRVLAAFHQALQGEIPLIGVGGILSGADARAKLAAGASLVQLYTGLIYRGPALVRECVEALRDGPASVRLPPG